MTKSISTSNPRVVAICISAGGVPKRPLLEAEVGVAGIHGDLHAHDKHNRPDRALSLFDVEILRQLVDEGFPLVPETVCENIVVQGLNVQKLQNGTLLKIGEVIIRPKVPREPSDVIDLRLKEAIVGRCGYMASVLQSGISCPGMTILPG